MRVAVTSQPLQIITQRGGRLVTAGGIFFERSLYNPLQLGGHVAIQLSGSHGSAIQDRVKDQPGAVCLKRRSASGHFV